MRHVLYNNASIKLLDRENHVPVFAPDYVAVFDGELFEVLWLDVAVVLRMWMCKDECYLRQMTSALFPTASARLWESFAALRWFLTLNGINECGKIFEK